MPSYETIAIVGVGLIGGSVGLAVREAGLAKQVVGIGRNEQRLNQAMRLGCVTTTTSSLAQGVSEAELVVICTPVDSIAKIAREAAKAAGEGTVLTDAGSTKASIVEAIESDFPDRREFVGSHPLAGSEKQGPEHARGDLFQNRACILTPTRRTDEQTLASVRQFWESLGCQILTLSPDAHDAALAATSHAPHVIASLLAAITDEKDIPLVAGGWLDTTRVAAGDAQLWKQILTNNRDHTLKVLHKFEKVLTSFCLALESEDDQEVVRHLAQGKSHRDAVGNRYPPGPRPAEP